MSIKNTYDRRFLIEIAVFIALLYAISSFVYLNGDDFMYAAFAKTGLIRNVTDYYFTGNGRYWINVLDSLLLRFGRIGFVLVLPWIVLAFVVLFAKNVQRIMDGCSDRSREQRLIRMGMVLFACLDVMCLRETVFWITGMMNYLFPAVVLLFGYLLFQKSRAGELHGMQLIGYCAVCMLAASSVEQYALMFVGLMTLHHGYDMLKKRAIPAYEWITYGFSLLGLAMLLLAPGNFQRVEEQQMPSLISNAWTLLHQNTVHDVAFPFLFMLSLIGAWIGRDAKKCAVKWYMQVFPWCMLLVLCTPLSGKALVLLPLILAWIMQMAIMCAVLKSQRKAEWAFWCIVGIGSQLMLLVSAVWGFRCMLSLYVVYMLLIGCLIYRAEPAVRYAVLGCGVAAAVHPLLAFAAGAVCLPMLMDKKHDFSKAAKTMACLFTIVSLALLTAGYGRNAPVHRENLRNTETQTQAVELQELPDDRYSWYFVPFSEFHENYYRILHGISEETDILYVQLPE